MKTPLRISLLLNLALLGSLIFLLANPRKQPTLPASALPEAPSPLLVSTAPGPSSPPEAEPQPFRWSQLASAKDYRVYVVNLRAMGCPGPTVEDIVRGDTDRAFSWERRQLGLDGSGTGPWSRLRELQLVANLLGTQLPAGSAVLAQNAGRPSYGKDGGETAETGSPSYPLFLQNLNWNALGFTSDQQATIAQVRQQFQNQISSLNQNSGDAASQSTSATSDASGSTNPNDSSVLTRWQKALQNANNQLRDLLGAQAYAAYEQQQYYTWYQPQVVAANAQGEPLTINPDAFSLK
jgi:hypothetical protein